MPRPPQIQRQHRGDFMSPETRSRVMGRIKGKDTHPERQVQAMLEELGVAFVSHDRDLPGRPDFVLRQHSLCIFVDGDFWHGWRFDAWRMKLSEHWESKIAANKRRDELNRRRLRRAGWQVLRIWEHQIHDAPDRCRDRIRKLMEQGLPFVEKPGSVAGNKKPIRTKS